MTLPDPVSEAPIATFDGVAAVALGDVQLTLWKTAVRRERVRWMGEWAKGHVRSVDGTVAACQFLLPSASPPDRGGRAEARAALLFILARARRLIVVPLGDAVWRGIVRRIIRAALVLIGRADVIKVASNEQEAFDWLTEVATAGSPDRRQLQDGLGALFAALAVEPPTSRR